MTPESFASWKKKFDAEMEAKKKAEMMYGSSSSSGSGSGSGSGSTTKAGGGPRVGKEERKAREKAIKDMEEKRMRKTGKEVFTEGDGAARALKEEESLLEGAAARAAGTATGEGSGGCHRFRARWTTLLNSLSPPPLYFLNPCFLTQSINQPTTQPHNHTITQTIVNPRLD